MSATSMTHYRIVFDRIGRTRDVPPLDAHAVDADHLAEQIYRYARRFLISKDVEVWVGMDHMRGGITCGFSNGGSFTIEDGAR
ncbi:hypothetical protein QTQ03_25470 [Micromonospora sp. WMMA1363]|uniref:hypothetical protein n=1 Tax=Micromonospora sp. WMMA1363 TaxID=3053985 RepID=UPI00259CCD6D|nr:hypothetical protein [Micromonospora sp. WMMA1363]MDM4721124.1 hypothetical protein [Micromonospora sp. WMMA1363]MDM4722786.1 hypothetical protein [Micromonospora sp. WMMA1363]